MMRILIFFVLSREKMLVTPLGILYGGLLLLGLVAAYTLHNGAKLFKNLGLNLICRENFYQIKIHPLIKLTGFEF